MPGSGVGAAAQQNGRPFGRPLSGIGQRNADISQSRYCARWHTARRARNDAAACAFVSTVKHRWRFRLRCMMAVIGRREPTPRRSLAIAIHRLGGRSNQTGSHERKSAGSLRALRRLGAVSRQRMCRVSREGLPNDTGSQSAPGASQAEALIGSLQETRRHTEDDRGAAAQ
jgi:hypothetical protein